MTKLIDAPEYSWVIEGINERFPGYQVYLASIRHPDSVELIVKKGDYYDSFVLRSGEPELDKLEINRNMEKQEFFNMIESLIEK